MLESEILKRHKLKRSTEQGFYDGARTISSPLSYLSFGLCVSRRYSSVFQHNFLAPVKTCFSVFFGDFLESEVQEISNFSTGTKRMPPKF
jgi:hypothetical protein